jgi:hypothetical protein
MRNSDLISRDFGLARDAAQGTLSLKTFWTNLKRVSHPTETMTPTTLDQAWQWYSEASRPAQWLARTVFLFLLYLGIMWSLGAYVVDEEYIHPCRGRLSCTIDSFMTRSWSSSTWRSSMP